MREPLLTERAVVDTWIGEDGWGTAVTEPSGHHVWIHYSVIKQPMDQYLFDLRTGTAVELTYVRRDQDGYDYAAEKVVILEEPDDGETWNLAGA